MKLMKLASRMSELLDRLRVMTELDMNGHICDMARSEREYSFCPSSDMLISFPCLRSMVRNWLLGQHLCLAHMSR
jgi:hypothetical protein